MLAMCSSAASACETGTPTTTRFYPQSDDIPFYVNPSKDAARVINDRATEIMKRTQYRTLERAVVLQGMCETPEWIQGKIVEADGHGVDWESGWVERRFVNAQKDADQEAGLLWNPDTEKDMTADERAVVKLGALEVLKKRPDCGSVVLGSRSQLAKPGTYFVMCSPRSGLAFNVWFTVTLGKPETLRLFSRKP